MGRHYFQFGPYRLDPLAHTLLRDNEAVGLTPKAAETLRVLVQQAGVVVSKETLLREVWPGTFVEEGGLTRNICDLRRVLTGFEDGGPIQTIPRRGYRFVAPVLEREEKPIDARKVLAVHPIRVLDHFDDPGVGQRFYEAVVNRLATIHSFRVLASASGTDGQVKGETNWSPDFDLEANLQRQNGSLRLSVRLQKATGGVLWAENLDGKADDLFRLEDSLSEEIAGAVGLLLSTEQPKVLSRRYTEKDLAYRLYLRGRFHWHRRSERELRLAIGYFRKALSEDPEYAPAYSALSSSYSLLPMVSSLRSHEFMPRAKAAAISALQIDETLAEARAALAFVKWHYDWKWKEADREYRRIIKFQPDHAVAHQWYGLMLVEMGRWTEAIKHAALASELDPSPSIRANHASVLYFAGMPNEAIEVAQKALADFPDSLRAHSVLGLALQTTGRTREAIDEFEDVYRRSNSMPMICGSLGHAYAASGRKADARQMLRDLENRPQSKSDFMSQALVQVGLGNTAKAIELLEKACSQREFLLVVLGVDDRLDPLRSYPAFQTILSRIGLA